MIDTIKLELSQSMYTILDHTKFTPSTFEMFSYGPFEKGSKISSNQNPTNKDKKACIYRPRLSIRRRQLKHLGYQNTLYVEFSIPKLVFGNNFDELQNKDFERVIKELTNTLKEMGVLAYSSQLPQAKVSSIHYGKNIVLEDYTTPYTYIKALRQLDIRKTHDINQTDYRNSGLSFKAHTNLFEFAFYDKIKELEKSNFSEKRSLDKDDYCQLSLLDYFATKEKNEKPFEVLRLEMRLNNRRKIKQHLKKQKLLENVEFQYLFDQDLAQQFLLSFYENLVKQYIPTYEKKSILQTFENIKVSNPEIKNGKLLKLASSQVIINEIGVREFRNLIDNATWYRLKRHLIRLKDTKQTNYLQRLKNELLKFTPVSLVDYPQIMLNNVN